jgi:class 3 adenylate cyclase
MQQIVEWLETLGMSEYAGCFAENRIDLSVLPDLTDQHLKDLGLPLGDRLKMLRAIRELAVAPRVSSDASSGEGRGRTPLHAATRRQFRPVHPAAEVSGERRYLTVMFCDLVGSTSYRQLDAEEWRDLVSGYLEAACAAVTEMGGHVARNWATG